LFSIPLSPISIQFPLIFLLLFWHLFLIDHGGIIILIFALLSQVTVLRVLPDGMEQSRGEVASGESMLFYSFHTNVWRVRPHTGGEILAQIALAKSVFVSSSPPFFFLFFFS
jgi:hypothetical protein